MLAILNDEFKSCSFVDFTKAMQFFLCHDLPSKTIYYKGDFVSSRSSKKSND